MDPWPKDLELNGSMSGEAGLLERYLYYLQRVCIPALV
jgi:hypothetical protein